MPHTTKHAITTITATALLALTVTTASANRLELVRGGETSIRVVWTSLELTNTARESAIRCPVTLEGSFHSATISKVAGALIGYITRASPTAGNSCTGGHLTIFNASLPWHIRYRSFTGTLPNITSITIGLVGARFQIQESAGQVCEALTSVIEPAVGAITVNATTHRVETLIAEPNARIALRGGTFEICALGRGIFGGASNTPTLVGSTAEFSVRLI